MLLTRLFPSVSVGPPVTSAVISPPKVGTVNPSVKSPARTLAPPTTWKVKVEFNVGSSISPKAEHSIPLKDRRKHHW